MYTCNTYDTQHTYSIAALFHFHHPRSKAQGTIIATQSLHVSPNKRSRQHIKTYYILSYILTVPNYTTQYNRYS